MSGIHFAPGEVPTITKDGRLVFDASLPLLNLVPEAAISLIGYAISWPDLWRGTIYHQIRETIEFPPGVQNNYFSCASFVGLVPQEWGPGRANDIADVTLGTVPAGTDHLDVLVNLTNTIAPGGFFDLAAQTDFPSGNWVRLEGGTCGIETFPGFERKFDIVLDGTTVKLKRYQSVGNQTGAASVLRTFQSGALGNAVQWISGANAGLNGSTSANAVYGGLIDHKGPSAETPTHRPPGHNLGAQDPCATGGPSYASTWTGDILITPGRIGV